MKTDHKNKFEFYRASYLGRTHPQDREDIQDKILVTFHPRRNNPKSLAKYISDTLKML